MSKILDICYLGDLNSFMGYVESGFRAALASLRSLDVGKFV